MQTGIFCRVFAGIFGSGRAESTLSVYEMLKKGSEKAEAVAAQTLAEVKAAMKINYFDDTELIKAQSEQFAE